MVTRNEALKLALEALEDPAILNGVNNAKFLIKEALAQPEQKQTGIREIRVTETVKPEQEPVADGLVRQYINSLVANKPDEAANATKAMVDYVYTPLTKRSWVDLTEQEALDCFSPNPVTHRRNIAAKLKEKNT